MRYTTFLLPAVLLTLCVGAAPLAAQAGDQAPVPAAPTIEAPASTAPAGMIEGITSASASGTGLWTIGGFVGGALLGPIGTGLAYVLADASPTLVSEEVQATLKKKGSDFALVYQQAYSEHIVAKRKRSTLTGGVTGTALMLVGTFALYVNTR